jgi:hypothetical protein
MAIEIKNELRAAAIINGGDAGGVIQIFGMTFERTGPGVYVFTLDGAGTEDPSQLSIYCTPGINELAQPRGRFTSSTVLEVRSYTPEGVAADCVVLFVEVHRYPGVLGRVLPAAPPIPLPMMAGGPIFPANPLGKVDVDWTNITGPGSQTQSLGLDLVPPNGEYSIVQVAGRMVGANVDEIAAGDFAGTLAFDDSPGNPSGRFLVGIGEFVGTLAGPFSFSAWSVAANGILSLTLANTGSGTNFVRMALEVGQPIVVPFAIAAP